MFGIYLARLARAVAVVTAVVGGLPPVLAMVQAPPTGYARSPLLLAVLSRDGYAMPFASFDGRRWRSPWPDHRNLEMPISIDDVESDWWGIGRRPDRMAWWVDGAKRGEISLKQIANVQAMCSTRIGLRTDHTPSTPAPPRMKQPYPKDGLLVAGDASVDRIDIVEPGSPDWNRMLIGITDRFNKVETAAARSFESWRHPFNAEARKLRPLILEAVYRAPNQTPGWTTYFVEAVRAYPPRPEDRGCGLSTTGQGWVHVGPKGDVKVELTARATYCDRKGVGFMLPLGLIRAADRTYWVYQFSGFEGEWYLVSDVRHDGVRTVASFHAGACPG